MLVDIERRVLDVMMVILGPLEDDGTALEGIRAFRVGEIAVVEFLRDDTRLHDRGIEEVAPEDEEAGVLNQRILERADDVLVVRTRGRGSSRPSSCR